MQRVAFIHCHDWLIDKSLLKKDFADLRYVNTCIEVRRTMEKTTNAMENTFVPISFIYEPALTTSLGRISWVNQNNSFSNVFSFICEKLPELEVSPIASHPVESPAFSSFSYVFKSFQSKSSIIQTNYPLAQTMVKVFHEPSFSARKRFKFSLCRPSAERLQSTTQVSIMPFNFSDMFRLDENIIAQNSKVLDTQVNSKNFFIRDIFRNFSINNNFEIKNFFINPNSYCLDFPIRIFSKVIGNVKFVFFSSFNRCKLKLFRFKEYFSSPQIKSDRTIQSFRGLNLIFIPFKHFNSIISRTLDKCRRKVGMFIPNLLIQRFMKFGFGIGFKLKGFSNMFINNLVILSNSFKNFRIFFDLKSYYPLHRGEIYV